MPRIHSFLVVLGVLSMAMGLGGCGGGASSAPDLPEAAGNGSGNTGSGTGGSTGVVIGAGGNGGAAGGAACEPGTPGCTQVLPPGCGDRIVQADLTETCDDGNTLAGDGCNGACQTERNYTCPADGGACSPVFRCGDGKIDPGEVCDQGQYQGSPGCSADCTVQDPAYSCAADSACIRVSICGDGRVTAGENCEDGNTVSGDGCSSSCIVETGWVCKTPGSACVPGPRCGDGILQIGRGEECDDFNTADGDGCSAICEKTPGCTCLAGQPCSCPTPVCGDGKLQAGEQCDDGNTNGSDGCSSSCQLETGYWCPFPAAPCTFKCGDGVVSSPAEQCDPGVAAMAQACASNCKWNPGWLCEGSPVTCRQTVCGNSAVEGSESCDDGNSNLGDGCTPGCKIEPNCSIGACTSKCGDGIIIAPEICDDGNNISGDGCSSDCSRVEDGYRCSQPEMTKMTVPAVFRDFNANGQDFEHNPAITGSNSAITGIVQSTLVNGKPVFSGTNTQQTDVNFTTLFPDWYNASSRSIAVPGQIDLYPNTTGGYVNRWGPNGEQWKGYTNVRWCGDTACSNCNSPAYVAGPTTACLTPCTPWNNGQTCAVDYILYDGNPTYFPVDGKGYSPASVNAQAHIPPLYLAGDASWPLEPGGPYHNFSFTSEVRYWFLYDSSKTYQLQFTGDDDVWVFVNHTLAVDLGGIHIPVSGSFSLPTDAAKFSLTSGNVYEIALFHAERQTTGSTFMLTLSGFNTSPSVCGPLCGNSIVQPGEQCDNGADNCNPQSSDCYNQCTTSCLLGGYCGDAITNGTEECDNGSNTDTYWKTGACGPGCKIPPRCGDGIVQPENGEECDNGTNNTGAYGGCNSDCTLGPYCGDAVVGGPERCDDGKNDGTYGTCGDPSQALPNCNFGPRCGDGVQQSDWGEACDSGSANCNPKTSTCLSDSCLVGCRLPGGCGDGIKDSGEECDYGTCPMTDTCNDGEYGGCSPGCVLAPHCGDGIKNGPEACDDGVNDNTYGTCAPNCKLAPYCGDGIKNGPEDCDHGAGNGTDGLCTTGCKAIVYIPT